jgi:cytochrome P450
MSPLPPGPKGTRSKSLALSGLRERPLEFIVEMANAFGDLVYFGSGRDPICFVTHPKLVREILVSRPQTFVRADVVCNALRVFDGNSILVTEGDLWRQQRRLLQEGFHAQRLRAYAHEAVVQTQEMLRQWPSVGTLRIGNEVAAMCVKALFSIVLGTQPPPDVVDSIRVILDARAVEAGKAVAAHYAPTAISSPEIDQALSRIHEFLDELIWVRRRESADQSDILSMLVNSASKNVNDGAVPQRVDGQIRDETISMINASLDPLAAAMQWALCLVARHEGTQERVRREVTVAAAGRKELTPETAELPLTEMVIHESLRLYPPNWMLIPRRCREASELGGFRIPRGSWLYVLPYVIHRDARWFTAPDSFQPERFAPENFGGMQRAAYLPLGLGPHVCIGKALSTIVLTTTLACILREFRVSFAREQPDLGPDVGIVLRPRSDLGFTVKRLGDVGGTPTSLPSAGSPSQTQDAG